MFRLTGKPACWQHMAALRLAMPPDDRSYQKSSDLSGNGTRSLAVLLYYTAARCAACSRQEGIWALWGLGSFSRIAGLRRRIIISLGLLAAVCLVGDAIAMVCLYRSTRQLGTLAESHRIQVMRARLTSDGIRVEADLLSFLAGHKHSVQRRSDNVERFTTSLNGCKSCHHPPHLASRLDTLRDTFDEYGPVAEQLYACDDAEQRAVLEGQALMLADRFVEQTTQMVDQADKHLASRSMDATSSIRNAWIVLSVTLVALAVGGGVVAFHLKGRLTGPVESLLEGIDRVGAGDLSHHFSIEADEEFRLLGDAFNRAYGDLKRAQESMYQTEKLAAVGKLAAGVAHEVLNPLASISSIAQMMRRDGHSDGKNSEVDLIMQEVKRISHVLRELLTFSRPAPAEQHSPVEIGPLLEHATTLIGYDQRARRTEVICRIESDLNAVWGDSQRLLLVFTNIMINALDALSVRKDGEGTLNITARNEGPSVVIEFVDNGPGMGDEQLAHAFDPFFTTKEPGAGTGLGLWICDQVIQRHKGTVKIDSRVGEGARVTIHLPCGLCEQREDPEQDTRFVTVSRHSGD